MKLRWKKEGEDWIVQLSGALRWLATGPGPISRLRDEAERFARDGKGLAIIDFSEVSEADPRNVLELFDALRPLRAQKRARLRGRGSAIAAIVGDGDIPWIDEPADAGTAAGSAAQPSPSASLKPTPKPKPKRESTGTGTPPNAPASQAGSSWERIIEALPEGSPEVQAIWGQAAEKIEAMVTNFDTPSDSQTDVIDPRDRAPAIDDPLPAPQGKVKRRSTEQLSAPMLWFDDALDKLLGDEPPPAAPPPKRTTREKPVPGVKSIPQSPPPGADVFDWFFSMGDAAVLQDEQARRAEENISKRKEPTAKKPTPAEKGSKNPPSEPAPVNQAAPQSEGSNPPASPGESPQSRSVPSLEDDAMSMFGFPNLEEFESGDTSAPEHGESPPSRPAPPKRPAVKIDQEVAKSVRPEAEFPRVAKPKTATPATAAPLSEPDSGVFEPFGFPSIEEIGELITVGGPDEKHPKEALPPRPAGFEKFPQLYPTNPPPPLKQNSAQANRAQPSATEGNIAKNPASGPPRPTAQGSAPPSQPMVSKPNPPTVTPPKVAPPSMAPPSMAPPSQGARIDTGPRGGDVPQVHVTRPGSSEGQHPTPRTPKALPKQENMERTQPAPLTPAVGPTASLKKAPIKVERPQVGASGVQLPSQEAMPSADLFPKVAKQSSQPISSETGSDLRAPLNVVPPSTAQKRVTAQEVTPMKSPSQPVPDAAGSASAVVPRVVAPEPVPPPVEAIAKPTAPEAMREPTIEEFLARTGLAATPDTKAPAPPVPETPSLVQSADLAAQSAAAPIPAAQNPALPSAAESSPQAGEEAVFDDEDLDDEGFDDDTFSLLTTPTDRDDSSEDEMIAGELGSDGASTEHEVDDDFVIDLELEQMYLTRSPNQRDIVAKKKTLEFNSSWSTLEKGSEFIESEQKNRHGRPDPVSLLLGGGGNAKDAYPPEQPEDSVVDDGWGAPAPARPPSRASRAKLENAAQPFLEFFPSGPAASSGSRQSNRSDEMMRAIGRLLGDYESADREREELAERYDQLVDAVTEKDQEIENLRRALNAMGAGSDAAATPEAPAGWLTTLMVTPSNPEQLRIRYAGSLARFRASGTVDPERVLSDITELDRRAPRIAAGVGASLERFSGTPGDGWRAMLLVLSTLVRDQVDPARRRRGIRAAWLASLVRNAPGNEETTLDFVVPAVWRLLSGRTYRFPGEEEFDYSELREDLALWVACAHLDAHRRLTPKRWRAVIGRTLANFEEDEQVRQGLSRLVEAHSLYFPGVWVELTTGGIGPVIGANPGRPEFPRVLVLFRRDGMRGTRVPPQLSPTGVDATAGVLRVLSSPHCAEKDGNSLAIDTGGSTVVPKNR